MKKRKFKNYLKSGILLIGISLLLFNCDNDNEIINSQEVTERKKLDLDYRLERISHSDLIEDDEIKESLPLIEHRFSNQEKQIVSNKNSTQVAEGLTILTEKINRIVTESVITWTFEIETPILESSDFENFLIKKHSDEFHYFLVSYIKDIENDENLYKKATLYPISKESLNLDNLNLASKGEYFMDDDTVGGGDPCGGVIYTEIEPCNQRGFHTAKYCCQHYGGIHGCSNSKPCDYTCTGTNIVTVIDFSHCRNGGSLGLDDIPDYNSSNNDNTQNSDGGMNDSGGSTSSNGGETITSPVELECDNCSNSLSLISYLNLTEQTQLNWVNDANSLPTVILLNNFLITNSYSISAQNFVLQAINALIVDSSNELNLFMLNLGLFQDTKITFTKLWDNYEDIKNSHFDGDKSIFSNYCAINLSHALLKSGITMSSYNGAECWGCVSAENNNQHAIRAQELANWLINSNIDGIENVVTLTGENFRNYISGKKGIIFFQDYWQRPNESETNRTGDHIDLWDGNELASSNFFFTWFRLAFPEITESIADTSSLYKSKTVLFWEIP